MALFVPILWQHNGRRVTNKGYKACINCLIWLHCPWYKTSFTAITTTVISKQRYGEALSSLIVKISKMSLSLIFCSKAWFSLESETWEVRFGDSPMRNSISGHLPMVFSSRLAVLVGLARLRRFSTLLFHIFKSRPAEWDENWTKSRNANKRPGRSCNKTRSVQFIEWYHAGSRKLALIVRILNAKYGYPRP